MLMFQAIQTGISEADAKEMYPDKYMILLIEDRDMDDWVGDLIFVGTEQSRRTFDRENEIPEGYLFFMIKGITLERLDSGSVQPVTPFRLESVQHAI